MRTRNLVLLACALVTALTLVTPVGRVARHTELSYNEGWNVAAAMRLAPGAVHNAQLPVTTGVSPLSEGCCQTELYPATFGWTTVNYPALSFAVLAALHNLTGDYLVTGRVVSVLSLLACAVLLGRIAAALGANRRAALLTALLCLATFSVCAVDYAGVDDPQLLGDACFLLALFVYVRGRRGHAGAASFHAEVLPTYATVALVAALFAVAGCIKQSPIDFPIAVLVDLLLLSRKRAAWFAGCGLVVGALAVLANRYVGGPWFVQQLLLGRLYSVAKARDVALSLLGPMLLPLLAAGYIAWQLRHDNRRRIAALLLVTSIAVGTYFGGGSGVAGNALFTALLSIVLLLGLALSRAEAQPWAAPATLLAFAWLLVPALVQHVANPGANLREARASEARFAIASQFLQQHPGPALCESILLCLESGKPYIFDPFNSTRLLLQGRLSQTALLDDIQHHRYSAIQLHAAATEPDDLFRERFTEPVLRSIAAHYTITLQAPDVVLYLPRR